MAGILPAWPVFYANLAEADKRPVFWKSGPKAGIVKMAKFQKELTPNFSNYNDSSSESCQDSSFSEVHLLLLTQSLVRFSRRVHTET